MPGRIRGTHHVAVQVRDLAAAEAFYAKVLGLTVRERFFEPDGVARSVWVELGDGSFLALEKSASGASPAGFGRPFKDGHAGWHLLALRIGPDERAGWEDHLRACGVEIEFRSRWTLYVRDPDGNRVGLSHHPDDPTP